MSLPTPTPTPLDPHTQVYHTTLPAPFPGAPGFTFHLTRMKDTLFIWVGADGRPGEEQHTRLAGEWAVAMPSRGAIPATATPVFRSGATDTALPMSQRLAKRFPPNQIHLSLSLPSALTATGANADPYASKALLAMEKKLGAWLAEVLSESAVLPAADGLTPISS